MKKIIYKSTAIKFIILLLAVMTLATLWPLRIWKQEAPVSVQPDDVSYSEFVDKDKVIMQTFLAQQNHLKSMRLYLGEGSQGEFFYARMYDEKHRFVAEEEVKIPTEGLPCYVEFPMDLDMEAGKTYFFTLQGVDLEAEARQGDEVKVSFGYEFISPEEMPGAGIMYYNEEQVFGAALVADYNYDIPIGRKKTAVSMAGILFLAALLFAITDVVFKNKDKDKLITVERAFRFVANPVVTILMAGGILTILMKKWSPHGLDNAFYMVSILLAGGVLFYGINHNRDGQAPVVTGEYIREHLADLFQSVCIAGVIAACCEYMSGLYDIHHLVAERKEMLWFALAVLAMFSFKDLVNRTNLIYLILAGIGGVIFYKKEIAQLMAAEYPEAELVLRVHALRNTIIIAILAGLIILRIAYGLYKKKSATPRWWYAGLVVIFFGTLIVFRNTRWWTVVLAVSFLLFYLAYGMWKQKERLLTNVLRGVLFHFLLALGYALLHRPYSAYEYARYPFIFHTVTTTATYLVFVECAAVVLLLMKLLHTSHLRDVWKELCLFGIVSSYMLFTMSRTGLFTIGAVGLVAWLVLAKGRKKERFMFLLRNLLLLIGAVVVMFPITFTAQRNIPILVSEPRSFEIENWHNKITRERNFTSSQYMRVGRFIEVFADKMFNVPEGTFDFYGENEEYLRLYAKQELVASTAYMPRYAQEQAKPQMNAEDGNDYTNGRTTIFRSYLEQLNATGHDTMGATLPDGEIAAHAHNIYLQVAYDHGIGAGMLFVLFGIVSLIMSAVYYKRHSQIAYAAFPLFVILSFGIAGMVEWIFHLSSPCTIVLLMTIAPLLYKDELKVEREHEEAV